MGFFSTWKAVTFHPAAFFSLPAGDHPRRSSWRFAFAVHGIGVPAAVLWTVLLTGNTVAASAGIALIALVISPLHALLVNSLAAVAVWFGVRLFRRPAPFRAAQEMVNYACGPWALMVVPLGGAWAATFLSLRALFAGLRRRFALSSGSAIFLVIALAVASIASPLELRSKVATSHHVPSNSMAPTMLAGDFFFTDNLAYRWSGPRRGDVVVFASPKNPANDYVKRVIGIAGDRISVHGHDVSLNGTALGKTDGDGEPYEYEDVSDSSSVPMKMAGRVHAEELDGLRYRVLEMSDRDFAGELELEIPKGSIFVLGDNRDNSLDSRYLGPIPAVSVRGRASLIWMSFEGTNLRFSRIGTRLSAR